MRPTKLSSGWRRSRSAGSSSTTPTGSPKAWDRPPVLLHGGGGQGRKADDIAHRVDVPDLGAVVLVDLEPTTRVGGQARRLDVQLVTDALSAGQVARCPPGSPFPIRES